MGFEPQIQELAGYLPQELSFKYIYTSINLHNREKNKKKHILCNMKLCSSIVDACLTKERLHISMKGHDETLLVMHIFIHIYIYVYSKNSNAKKNDNYVR